MVQLYIERPIIIIIYLTITKENQRILTNYTGMQKGKYVEFQTLLQETNICNIYILFYAFKKILVKSGWYEKLTSPNIVIFC